VSGGGAAVTARLWVSTGGNDSGGTCARQGSPVAFASLGGNGCLTTQKACSLANGGDTIGVENGTYATQLITCQPASLVTFVPDGGTVTFGGLCIGGNGSAGTCLTAGTGVPAQNVKFNSLGGNGSFVYTGGIIGIYRNGCSGATCFPTGDYINGGHSLFVGFDSSKNTTVNGVEIGPNCCSDDGVDISVLAGHPNTNNFVFTNNYLHDLARLCAAYPGQSADGIGPSSCPGNSTAHVDCFQAFAANGLNISGNRFYNCATQGMFLGGMGQANGPSDTTCPVTTVGCYDGLIRIENNMVGSTYEAGGPWVIGRYTSNDPEFGPSCDMEIRNNSTTGDYARTNYTGGTGCPTVNITNNIGSFSSSEPCTLRGTGVTTVTFSHNFLVGKTCGASDTLLTGFGSTFTNTAPTSTDMHLQVGSPEVDAGDSGSYPATDLDGQSRPDCGSVTSPNPDVGADEDCSGTGNTGSGGSGMTVGRQLHTYACPLVNASYGTAGTGTCYYGTYKPPTATCGTPGCPLVFEAQGSPGGGGCFPSAGVGMSQALALCTLVGSTTNINFNQGCASGVSGMWCSGWQDTADANNFILVMPVMCTIKTQGPITSRCGGDYSYSSGVTQTWFDWKDFYSHVESTVEHSSTEGANIDTNHIYLAGDSAGANTAVYKTMCGSNPYVFNGNGITLITPPPLTGSFASFYMNDVPSFDNSIRGVVVWSGSLQTTANNTQPPTTATQGAYTCNMNEGSHPFSVFKIQGTADASVPWAGACAVGQTTAPASCAISAAQDITYLTNGGASGSTCTLTSSTTSNLLTQKLYTTGCAAGTGLEYDEVSTGAHDGALYFKGCVISTLTKTCTENVSAVAYAFLAAHAP
jgi:poly(3-hydroxybutyrate) depolymerase